MSAPSTQHGFSLIIPVFFRRTLFLSKVAFEGHWINWKKASNLSWSSIIERLKHSTILNICQQTLRLSVHKRLKSIAKLPTFFFCEDKQSPADNKRLDYLRVSFSVRFLSDATLVMVRLPQNLFFLNMSSKTELYQDFALQYCNTLNSFFCPHLEIKCSTS